MASPIGSMKQMPDQLVEHLKVFEALVCVMAMKLFQWLLFVEKVRFWQLVKMVMANVLKSAVIKLLNVDQKV